MRLWLHHKVVATPRGCGYTMRLRLHHDVAATPWGCGYTMRLRLQHEVTATPWGCGYTMRLWIHHEAVATPGNYSWLCRTIIINCWTCAQSWTIHLKGVTRTMKDGLVHKKYGAVISRWIEVYPEWDGREMRWSWGDVEPECASMRWVMSLQCRWGGSGTRWNACDSGIYLYTKS